MTDPFGNINDPFSAPASSTGKDDLDFMNSFGNHPAQNA